MRLLAYYDLRCAPLSFDFALYLSVMAGYAELNGFTRVTLCILAPFYRKTNWIEIGYPEGYENRKVHNVLLSLAGLVPIIDDIIFVKSGQVPKASSCFPPQYDPTSSVVSQGSARSLMPSTPFAVEDIYRGKGNPRVFKPTQPGTKWVETRFGFKTDIITISLRQTPHNPFRNCSIDDFYNLYTNLLSTYPTAKIIVIPDQDDLLGKYIANNYNWTLVPEAALDHELRLALYCKAALNIAWTSGTASLLMMSDSSYIIFGIWNENSIVSAKSFFDRKGPHFGRQLKWALPGTQIIDWTHAPDVTSTYMFETAKKLLNSRGDHASASLRMI